MVKMHTLKKILNGDYCDAVLYRKRNSDQLRVSMHISARALLFCEDAA